MIEGREGSNNEFRSENSGSAGNDSNSVNVNVVGPKYFQTMGIPLLRGRDLSAEDTEEKPSVVVVNESFANRHLPARTCWDDALASMGRKDLGERSLVLYATANTLRFQRRQLLLYFFRFNKTTKPV
jgi:hypothetical protein